VGIAHKTPDSGNTRIIATEQVWMEGEAVRQLEQVACDPDCVAAVGMPDLHPGPGVPIGAAFGFASTVRPQLVGSDAGCGALVVALGKGKLSSTLARRARAEFDGPVLQDVDTDALCRAVWRRGARALTEFDLPDSLVALAERLDGGSVAESGEPPDAAFGDALGTIGGGNHFAEVGRVSQINDLAMADALGVRKGGLVVLCHSGSRGLGKAVSDKWGHAVLSDAPGGQLDAYLADLAGAVRFAQANRVVLAWRMLKALGMARPGKVTHAFDVVHNFVRREDFSGSPLWVHRKGCAPAADGEPAVVLGSRGAPSYIMRGRGNPDGLCSVAHGAGRKMQRSEARDKLRHRYRRAELAKSKCGSVVLCDDTKLLYEEHPDAYKPIVPVIDSLTRSQLADSVAAIDPVLTVKR